MKRSVFVVSLALVLTLVIGLFAAPAAYTSPDEAGSKVRVMVQYAPGKKAAVEKSLNANGGKIHYSFDKLRTFAVTLPKAAADALAKNSNVAMVEEDVQRFPVGIMPSAVQAPLAAGGQTVPYGIDMVQARDVWDANRDGNVDSGAVTASNRKICIIDSGFLTSHEDLQGITVSGYNGNLAWDQDGSGHGSHVAGTIAAMNNALGVLGVTPGTVQIYVVRVFGDDGAWAYSSSLVDAANRCASAGANIISMSLGGGRSSQTEKSAFASIYSQGILSIAAAGNDGTTTLSYPASYDSVVSVAAIDSNKLVADFSQKNSQVELSAPGVGVLSTVPYLDATSITVSGVTYAASHVEFSARGTVTAALVNGGLCDATNAAWSGKVVLCQRGVVSFLDKVNNVKNSGGAAAVLYNNAPGGFIGTLGAGNSSTIVAISLSQEDGQYLIANQLGQNATVSSTFTQPASGYEYYDGTSMATPHVSAVAALVWGSKPSATNADIRAVLQQTAEDLGTAGRDNSYGFGLVRTKTAIDALAGSGGGGGSTNTLSVASITASKTVKGTRWSATFTTKAVDQNGAAVSGVVVSFSLSGSYTGTGTCTTGTAGTCAITISNMTGATETFTVTNMSKSGYTYNASANTVSSITVAK